MYRFEEKFIAFGPDDQPSGIEVERRHGYTHLGSRLPYKKITEYCDRTTPDESFSYRYTGNGYAISIDGNRYLFTTPELRNFELVLNNLVTYAMGKHSSFGFVFRYDRKTRTGDELFIESAGENEFNVIFNGEKVSSFSHAIEDDRDFTVALKVEENTLSLDFDGTEVILAMPTSLHEKGRIALTKNNVPGEWVLKNAVITSSDDVPETVLIPESKVVIPMTDGGNQPYWLKWSIVDRGGARYVDYTFGGGVTEHDQSIIDSGYSVEHDYFVDLYVRAYPENGDSVTAYVKSGIFKTTDPGLQWKALLSKYFGVTELPVSGSFILPRGFDTKNAKIALGYGFYSATGFNMQANGPSEYVYDTEGNLLSEGAPMGTDDFRLFSPFDKEAVRLIPETCYDYPAVKRHFQLNHYFTEKETVDLTLKVSTEKKLEFVTATCQLQDVFGTFMEELSAESDGMGSFRVTHAPMKVGVYRVEFNVYYGEKLLKKVNHAFEIFDPTGEKCAPTESGLPFMFSVPHEIRYLDRNTFDPWNPMPSNDQEHYFACNYGNDDFEKKRVWEVIPIFGRKWYVWLMGLGLADWDMDHHPEMLAHADYLESSICVDRKFDKRSDYHDVGGYNGSLTDDLHAFLSEHPEYASKISYKPGGETINEAELKELLTLCGNEWMEYATEIQTNRFRDRQKLYRERHPGMTWASYGPHAIYCAPPSSYFRLRQCGYPIDHRLADDVFTGFAQFEDYPYACAYKTCRSAFFAMTTALWIPKLRLYPEQYRSSEGGCIDGAVKKAIPPFAQRIVPDFFQLTHMYEFVWNTAYFTGNGFDYIRDYGCMKRDFSQGELDVFVRGWKPVIEHSPARPIRSTAYLADFHHSDDTYEPYPHNISEENMGYLYEYAREGGIPAGFALKWESLASLAEKDTDLLVIPSMVNAPAGAADKIRQLYAKGVSIISLSDVSGLEDLFGLTPCDAKADVSELLSSDGKSEFIPPKEGVPFKYAADGAKVLLDADGMPVVTINGRAAHINVLLENVGITKSELLKKVLTDLVKALSTPEIVADSCGITAFEDVNGEKMLLAIDYSDYDYTVNPYTLKKTATIRFAQAVKDVESVNGVEINRLRGKDGVCGIEITLRHHESAVLRIL